VAANTVDSGTLADELAASGGLETVDVLSLARLWRETILGSGRRRTDRAELRLSARLLFVGVLISGVAGLFHPARAPANDHPAIFAEYPVTTEINRSIGSRD
jgi:hypothetical protein